MNNKAEGQHSSLYTMRRVLPFLRPYRFWVIVKLLCTILNAANDIFLVYVINILVNSSLSGDKEELSKSIQYMIIFIVIGIIMNFLDTYSSGRYSAYAARDMKDKFSSQIDHLPISYMETHHSGDLVSRMTNGITTIENFVKDDLMGIVFEIVRVSVSIIVMFFLSWKLLLFCIAILPLMAILTTRISRPLNEYSSRLQMSLAKSNSAVQDAISGIYMIKSYNLIQVMYGKFKSVLEQMLADSLLVEKRKSVMGSVSVFVETVPFLLFFLFGGYMVIQGDFTAGGLVAFAQLLTYLVGGMGSLPNKISNYSITAGVAGHLFELMDEKTERRGGKTPEISPSAPALEFINVSCSYDGLNRVLKDVSFTLPQGKTLALVGSSGSGKSTVFKLISGFYESQNGCIKLFDEALSEWELSAARSLISLVSQETFLFSGSIAENITCGKTEFNMKDVVRAAKMANIHDYIQSLPEGYQTLVGERGVKLSGGQRQRVSIARAILKDAPILLLDEPTSALDTESEMLIQEAIHHIMLDKTVLVVAHRLSTIIEADEVIVLDEGRIVESGTHKELLDKAGTYKRLYDKQWIKQAESLMVLEGEGA
ncbi:ABC transporter ATP-binding protein [Paenibacillus psychroresistens]|uniref:ABC transporter ATP-binding protein n=1 Tax=Paenibacillus psychroresistens TaxID=1778678 RepID=A0A6B8RDD4_9BACL|nr:ABC transporter ATP-binding protein [Paenibacillus psychroresistens]QGQ94219.1 ABC transporter ATP-binding protein [Paenibacillus psychroresistens]